MTLALHDEMKRTTQRWPVATGAKVDTYVRARIADAVAVQSGRVLATAHAELANRAMTRFVELLYDADNGRLYNVASTGRIKIPAPWSRWRHADYGLTDHGARVLRSVVVWRLAQLPSKHQLLFCDGRAWVLNVARFPTQLTAAAWLAQFPVTAEQWQAHNDNVPRRGTK